MSRPKYMPQLVVDPVVELIMESPAVEPLAEVSPALGPTEQALDGDDMGYKTDRPHIVSWRPIDEAPQDGRPIMVKLNLDAPGPGEPAIWHRTRRWEEGRWKAVGYWGNPVTKWRLKYEPLFWRLPVYGQRR